MLATASNISDAEQQRSQYADAVRLAGGEWNAVEQNGRFEFLASDGNTVLFTAPDSKASDAKRQQLQ
ncbi:MAG: hypothetical protein ACK58T_28450, partial [Phycisphaerae bacterium]